METEQEEQDSLKLHWQCKYEDCESPKLGSMDYCHTHLHGFRKMSREIAKPMKEKTVIKKQSDKRKTENTQYVKEARAWLVGKNCKICEDNGDKTIATEVHHKKGRENHLLLERKYWLPTCRTCHSFITENSAWSIENGYSLQRHANTEGDTI